MNRKIKAMFLLALTALLFALPLGTQAAGNLVLNAPVNGQFKYATLSDLGGATQLVVTGANNITYDSSWTKIDDFSGENFYVFNLPTSGSAEKTREAVVLDFIKSITFKNTNNTADASHARVLLTSGVTQKLHYSTDTRHYYSYAYGPVSEGKGPSWTTAFNNAQNASSQLGRSGYLTAVSSSQENTFVHSLIAKVPSNQTTTDIWIAGKRDENSSVWYWAAGPEANEKVSGYSDGTFTLGIEYDDSDANKFADIYDNWVSTEPNNSSSGEYYVQLYGAAGNWNDLPGVEHANIQGYFIEYGNRITGDTDEAFKITYHPNGGTLPAGTTTTVAAGTPLPYVLPTPSKTGYTFDGWYSTSNYADDSEVESITAAVDHVLYAKWTINTYEISYTLNGGSLPDNVTNPSSYTVEYDAFTLNNPTKEGYTFAGWTGSNGDTANTSVTIPSGSTGNKSYTANWQPISYTITCDLAGGSVASANPTSYTIESSDITLNNPTRNGYTFTGWTGSNGDTANTSVTIPSGSTGNRTYTANWQPISYTITCDLAGGSVASANPTSYTIESSDITLNNPTRNGYTFAGWTGSNGDTANTSVTIERGSTGDKTYTANWSANSYKIVYLNVDGATHNNPDTYTYGYGLTFADAEKPGWHFDGWYDFNGASSEGTRISEINATSIGDVTVTAKWSQIFGITYELFGIGKNDEDNPSTYHNDGSTITLKDPTNTLGYRFDGWYTDMGYQHKVETLPTSHGEDITLYARWKMDITGAGAEWDDANNQDDLRKDVTLKLEPTGEIATLPADQPDAPFVFKNLDVIINGIKVDYTLTADGGYLPEGYTLVPGTADNGYKVTLTHTPEQVSFTANIIWDDKDNAHGLRPSKVSVTLLANDQPYGEPRTLTEDNDWSYTWTLDKYPVNVRAVAVSYTAALEEVKHYQMTYDIHSGHTVQTFTLTCEDCNKPVILTPTEQETVSAGIGSLQTLSVKALRADSYEWAVDKGDGNGFQFIDQTVEGTYVIPFIEESMNGYRYKCTAINRYGTDESAEFVLEIQFPTLPQTGDNSSLLLWGALLAMTGAVFCLMMKKCRA